MGPRARPRARAGGAADRGRGGCGGGHVRPDVASSTAIARASRPDPKWIHPIYKKNVDFLIDKLNYNSRIEITRLRKSVII